MQILNAIIYCLVLFTPSFAHAGVELLADLEWRDWAATIASRSKDLSADQLASLLGASKLREPVSPRAGLWQYPASVPRDTVLKRTDLIQGEIRFDIREADVRLVSFIQGLTSSTGRFIALVTPKGTGNSPLFTDQGVWVGSLLVEFEATFLRTDRIVAPDLSFKGARKFKPREHDSIWSQAISFEELERLAADAFGRGLRNKLQLASDAGSMGRRNDDLTGDSVSDRIMFVRYLDTNELQLLVEGPVRRDDGSRFRLGKREVRSLGVTTKLKRDPIYPHNWRVEDASEQYKVVYFKSGDCGDSVKEVR